MQKNLLWLVYFAFVAAVVYFDWHSRIFTYQTQLDIGKYVLWLAFISFTAFSYYCSSKENLFKTVKKMSELFWGRQILIDLYIGLLLSLFIIYLHSGSVVVVLIWLLPCLLFGNLATLLYFAIHYNSILEKFIS